MQTSFRTLEYSIYSILSTALCLEGGKYRLSLLTGTNAKAKSLCYELSKDKQREAKQTMLSKATFSILYEHSRGLRIIILPSNHDVKQ